MNKPTIPQTQIARLLSQSRSIQGERRAKIFSPFMPRNPLISLDSHERIQGNPTPIIGLLRRERPTEQRESKSSRSDATRRPRRDRSTRSKGKAHKARPRRLEQGSLPPRLLVRSCAPAGEQRRRRHRRTDPSPCYGGDLSIRKLHLQPPRLPHLVRAPQRLLRLVPHEREAARQDAAIRHRAKQLPGGEELGAPSLQPFGIGARHADGEARKRRRLLAAPPGQERRLADESPAHGLRQPARPFDEKRPRSRQTPAQAPQPLAQAPAISAAAVGGGARTSAA